MQYFNIFSRKGQSIWNKFLLFYQSQSNHSRTISDFRSTENTNMVDKKAFKPNFIFNVWIICEESVLTLHVDTQQPHPETVVRRYSVKKVFLQISQNSRENTCARVSFLITLQASGCNFIKKEALAQALFIEFCEISKNTVSYKTRLVAASEDNRFRLTNWIKWTVSPNFVNRKLDLWMKKIFYGWSHQSLIERQNAMESILHLTYSHL